MSTELSQSRPWRDEGTLRRLFRDENLSAYEIADRFGCSDTTIYRWLISFGLKEPEPDVKKTPEPLKDRALVDLLYNEMGLTQEEIADRVGCGSTTVSRAMGRHGIEVRDTRPKQSRDQLDKINAARRERHMPLHTTKRGYEMWSGGFAVHRLAAIAWFGIDEVAGKHVHHKNGVKWDNRKSNLECLTPSEHSKLHYENLEDRITLNISKSEAQHLHDLIEHEEGGMFTKLKGQLDRGLGLEDGDA